ncbi:hypothetical protein [Azospirillum argentinense]|uniref:Uncharacterized protein n=1 Tax=Azospirillum argentinense TaxID=2970906 RepID=A0A5B0KZQ2_9PROT|nr:hypothetical protein [Azospirillum argentinense]KAA1057193.1 hypothetical protein FH063_001361 [Azospirillum argentinense]
MPYAAKDLSVLAYANGFTLWHYTTPDAAAQVSEIGYFNGAFDLLRIGDMILVNAGPASQIEGAVVIVSGSDLTNLTVSVTSLTSPTPAPPVITGANDVGALYIPATGTR